MVGLQHSPITRDDPVSDSPGAEARILAAAQRDPTAFAPLYEAYFAAIYRYCYARLGDAHAAEEAASQTFTNALSALPRFRNDGRPGSFRAWLFRIAHNVVVSHYRTRGTRQPRPLAEAGGVPDVAPTPEDVVVTAEAQRSIHAALAHLTTDQRRVVELRLAGLTDAEIARVTGRRHGAVRAVQYRALLKLRTVLAPEIEEASHA